jgi:hypothetical protein
MWMPYWASSPSVQNGTRIHELVHLAVKTAWQAGGLTRPAYDPISSIRVFGLGGADLIGDLTDVAAAAAGAMFGAPAGHGFSTPVFDTGEDFE